MRTLIINEQSRVLGVEQLRHIQDAVDRGENVVIFSNHQTEADPPVKFTFHGFFPWEFGVVCTKLSGFYLRLAAKLQ